MAIPGQQVYLALIQIEVAIISHPFMVNQRRSLAYRQILQVAVILISRVVQNSIQALRFMEVIIHIHIHNMDQNNMEPVTEFIQGPHRLHLLLPRVHRLHHSLVSALMLHRRNKIQNDSRRPSQLEIIQQFQLLVLQVSNLLTLTMPGPMPELLQLLQLPSQACLRTFRIFLLAQGKMLLQHQSRPLHYQVLQYLQQAMLQQNLNLTLMRKNSY